MQKKLRGSTPPELGARDGCSQKDVHRLRFELRRLGSKSRQLSASDVSRRPSDVGWGPADIGRAATAVSWEDGRGPRRKVGEWKAGGVFFSGENTDRRHPHTWGGLGAEGHPRQ